MTPEGKEAIRQEIAGYILGTAAEWMSLIDLHVDPVTGRHTPDDDHQYRVSWEFPTDDAAVITVKEMDHTEVARFGVTITVDTLPDLPPIGPENDPALAHEQDDWLPATFADCLPGDRIRIGQEETIVRRARRGQWHARNREWVDDAGKVRDHQTRWDHEELELDLEANPGMHVYPPATPIEILADAERAAVLTLQQGFPGSQIISSEVN